MAKRRSVTLNPQSRAIDKKLLAATLVLVVFGVVMVGNSSFVEAEKNFGDKFFYLRQQAVWALVGLLGMSAAAFFPLQKLRRLAPAIFWINIVLLVLVLIPSIGIKALGARRWLGAGGFVVQPAELVKLSLVLYLSRMASEKRGLLPFLFAVGLVVGLVILEPDLGTSLVIAGISGIVYFASGAPLAYFILLVPVALAAVLLLIFTSEYRRQRLMTFLNPTSDPLGASYHIRQILIALGSGGLFGLGLGQSRQKHFFLPEAQTDSIFAIIGEELGFVGASAVILIFVFIIWKGFTIAKNTVDEFSRLVAVGVSSFIALQAFVNLGSMVALFPLTGIPLPFISYGGSSLVVSMTSVGILLNISREGKA